MFRIEYVAAITFVYILFIYFMVYNDPRTGTHTSSSSSSRVRKKLKQNQVSHWTAKDRYPEVFSFVSGLNSEQQKVLSFGSSTGLEAKTLKEKYFQQSSVFGADIGKIVETASQNVPEANFFQSTTSNLDHHGPFNIIFAMSVLCRHPWEGNSNYPFKVFKSTVIELFDHLTLGGIIVIYNPSYRIQDIQEVSDRYQVLTMNECLENQNKEFCKCGFVDIHDVKGNKMIKNQNVPCIFKKIK